MKRAVLPRSRMLLMMMNIKRDVLRRRISVEVERGVIVLTQRGRIIAAIVIARTSEGPASFSR